MRSNNCVKCGNSMIQGFMIDRDSSSGDGVASWAEGAPQKSFWMGLRLSKRPKFDIQTWRCGRCGFLESYAPA